MTKPEWTTAPSWRDALREFVCPTNANKDVARSTAAQARLSQPKCILLMLRAEATISRVTYSHPFKSDHCPVADKHRVKV
jgi:hypothetical protein